MAGEKQTWEGGFKMGHLFHTPPKFHHLAEKKCHTITESKFVPSDPNQLPGQRGKARGVLQHLQPGFAKGITCFSTAVAQHSFSLVVPLCWATLGQHPCSPPNWQPFEGAEPWVYLWDFSNELLNLLSMTHSISGSRHLNKIDIRQGLLIIQLFCFKQQLVKSKKT